MSTAEAPAPDDAEDGGGSFRPADTMDLDEGEDAAEERGASRVLVGGEGGDFVAQTLSTAEDVGVAIAQVQARAALSGTDAADAEPLLGLLGQLGMTRAEVYRSVLDDALAELRERIRTMPQGALLSLLDASFRYVTIEELRAVPLAVLERLKPVPSSYLKQISRDVDLFRQLPVEVQRQCWELRGVLLRRHASPCLQAYGEEIATTMRNLDADLALAPLNAEENWSVYPPGAAPPDPQGAPNPSPGLPRRALRRRPRVAPRAWWVRARRSTSASSSCAARTSPSTATRPRVRSGRSSSWRSTTRSSRTCARRTGAIASRGSRTPA